MKFGGREAAMRVAEEIKYAYDARVAMGEPRAIGTTRHNDPPPGSSMSWLECTDNDSRMGGGES